MDIVDRATRSRMMSAIRSKNTNPEVRLRRFLHSHGFRFRLHVVGLPGRPDLVMKKHNLAVFVHGCFWHRHRGCPLATTPATNPKRWRDKFAANVERDHRTREALLDAGWRILVLWECGLRGRTVEHDLHWLPAWIRASEHYREWPVPKQDAGERSP